MTHSIHPVVTKEGLAVRIQAMINDPNRPYPEICDMRLQETIRKLYDPENDHLFSYEAAKEAFSKVNV